MASARLAALPCPDREWIWAISAAVMAGATGVLLNLSASAAVGVVGLSGLALVLIGRSGFTFALVLFLLAVGLPLHGFLTYVVGVPAAWKEAALAIAGTAGLLLAVRGRSLVHYALALAPLLAGLLSLALMGGRIAGLVPYIQIFAAFPIGYALYDISDRTRRILGIGLAAALGFNGIAVIAGSLVGFTLVDFPGVETTVGGSVRPGGLAGTNLVTASLLGLGLASILPGLVVASRSLRRSVFSVAMSIAVLIGLLASGARAPLVGLLSGGVYLMYRTRGPQRRRLSYAAAAGALTVLAALGVAYGAHHESALLARIGNFEALQASDTVRIDRWTEALVYFGQNPVAGNGPGSTGLAAVREFIGNSVAYFPSDLPVPVTESSLLKIAAELGVIGLVAMGAMLVSAFQKLNATSTPPSLVAGTALAAIVGQGLVFQNLEVYFVPAVVGVIYGFAVRLRAMTSPPLVHESGGAR